jgi:hypothetical protein
MRYVKDIIISVAGKGEMTGKEDFIRSLLHLRSKRDARKDLLGTY